MQTIHTNRKYKKVGVLPIRTVSLGPSSERNDKGPTLETLDFTIHIGSTPTFLYFDLYLNTAYAAALRLSNNI